MIEQKIQGMIAAPFTGFDADGALDTNVVPRYASMLERNGLAGVFVNGTSGEGFLMTGRERTVNAEAWANAISNDLRLIVHVGAGSVHEGMELARHAREIGAWGISTMAPTFPKISDVQDLVGYCEQLASAAPELPFYYYHIPALTGVYVPMLPFLKAVDGRIPNFAGIKYTFEALYEFNQCRRYAGGKFDLLHGQDETLLAALVLGAGQGCVGGTMNYAAGLYSGITDAFVQGDLEEARRLQETSMDLIDVISRYRGNVVAGKATMKLIGLDLGRNRSPFRNLEPEEEAALKGDLETIGFFDYCNQ